ncbi:TRADD-N-associated membrane domain-containing protein [Actinosynnema sp. CS-041913]|uniref:TRADD-N-associated membrane domain-containing protein n=1 Tax=Actinosynnema sp. CS-041913 TaxID=3239917 RepID=UPI003D92EF85
MLPVAASAFTPETAVGYGLLGTGIVAAVSAAVLAVRSQSSRSKDRQQLAAEDVEATKQLLDAPQGTPAPPQVAKWEQHATETARTQLDLYLRNSEAALRQSATSFRVGMAAAGVGFLVVIGSLVWLLAVDRDVALAGVISGVVCEAMAALFFAETKATRARTAAMLDRAQAEADRVVRARAALAVAADITDVTTRETFLADIGRWLLGSEPVAEPTAVEAQ